jgi:hypothetical protein
MIIDKGGNIDYSNCGGCCYFYVSKARSDSDWGYYYRCVCPNLTPIYEDINNSKYRSTLGSSRLIPDPYITNLCMELVDEGHYSIADVCKFKKVSGDFQLL